MQASYNTGIFNTCTRPWLMEAMDSHGLDKEPGLKFHVGS